MTCCADMVCSFNDKFCAKQTYVRDSLEMLNTLAAGNNNKKIHKN